MSIILPTYETRIHIYTYMSAILIKSYQSDQSIHPVNQFEKGNVNSSVKFHSLIPKYGYFLRKESISIVSFPPTSNGDQQFLYMLRSSFLATQGTMNYETSTQKI